MPENTDITIEIDDVPVENDVVHVNSGSGSVGLTSATLAPSFTGDVNDYSLNITHDVTEVGGVKRITANTVADGVIEGVVSIKLPFTTVLNVQATAMNVTNAPSVLNSERTHVAVEGTTLKIYASANASSSATIPVSWTAKGIK